MARLARPILLAAIALAAGVGLGALLPGALVIYLATLLKDGADPSTPVTPPPAR